MPRILTDTCKGTRKAVIADCDTKGEDLLSQIVMEDETWIRHSEKQAPQYSSKKKFQSAVGWKNCGYSLLE
jgi:hypothetical protein